MRRRTPPCVIFSVVLTAVAASCRPARQTVHEPLANEQGRGAQPEARSDYDPIVRLETAQREWDALGLSTYRLSLYFMGSWTEYRTQVTVRGSSVSGSITKRGSMDTAPSRDMDASEAQGYTVPGLFDKAHAALARPEDRAYVRITFNREYHFPQSIEYDDPKSIDEEGSTRVTSFQVLTP